jgi:hypothetical protein
VQVLHLGGALALVVLQQVDRLLADHARDDAGLRRHLDALADQDHRIPPADADEVDVTLVVDVRDDQADLVDVADDRDTGTVARPGDARGDRAHDVGGHLGERRARLGERAGRRRLIARRAGGGEQAAQDVGEGHRRAG